jgi:sensor histidine kinase YesM
MPHVLRRINDAPFRMVGIPLVGLLVYSISGFGDSGLSWQSQLTDYLFFIFISYCIWTGCALANSLIRIPLYRIRKIYFRLPIRFSLTITVSIIVSLILLRFWNLFFHAGKYTASQLTVAQWISTALSLQISSIYEIVYLNKERESDIVQMERTEKLKAQAQLDALKSQIDPHFIFNSLNTLSYLIIFNAEKAKHFNDTLAKVYRYILLNKEKDLIQLREEIEFASNYFYLLKIRYQAGLSMMIRMDNVAADQFLIPPLSLQILIENAIKHNYFSDVKPLEILITITQEHILVTNDKCIKKFDLQSSRIGLFNLNERCKLTMKRDVRIEQTDEQFSVFLPLQQI